MMHDTIITIGREFGSGGHEIARRVSESLSIPFYDREVILEAAKKSGLDASLFENAEEQTVSSFLYSIALGTYGPAGSLTGVPMTNVNETIFLVQSKVISELAEKGPCVFVGRCADYILGTLPHCHRFFVYGDLPARIRRISQLYDMDEAKAEALIVKSDKKRSGYYQHYTGQKWNDFKHYDLCINSSHLGIEGAAALILSYLDLTQTSKEAQHD